MGKNLSPKGNKIIKSRTNTIRAFLVILGSRNERQGVAYWLFVIFFMKEKPAAMRKERGR
jgi:hypothetical protein